jgi:hypothetical protein
LALREIIPLDTTCGIALRMVALATTRKKTLRAIIKTLNAGGSGVGISVTVCPGSGVGSLALGATGVVRETLDTTFKG